MVVNHDPVKPYAKVCRHAWLICIMKWAGRDSDVPPLPDRFDRNWLKELALGSLRSSFTNADPKAGCVLCDAKAIHAGHALPIQTAAGERASTGKALGKTASRLLCSVSGMPDLALSGRHPRNLLVAVGSHWLIRQRRPVCRWRKARIAVTRAISSRQAGRVGCPWKTLP